jgi:predicted nucleic acid-binding protein
VKVLVDTNVVLDVLLKQEPFYKDSVVVLHLASGGKISALLSAVSMTNIFYILKRNRKDSADIYYCLDELSDFFQVVPVTNITITSALALRWKDFEDAVQFISAKEGMVDFIITRNKADYKTSDIPCMTPTEFIAFLKEKEEAAENDSSTV